MLHSTKIEQRRLKPLLGTFVEVRARGWNERQVSAAVDQAFACVRTVESRMSAHDPQSDLGRIYERGLFEPVKVHPGTFGVIEASLSLHRMSDGVFDVTVGDVLERNRLLPRWRRKQEARTGGTATDIQLLDDCRIQLRRPLRLDLGGIAKGFAVDRAVEALMEAGTESGCVNAGGDFRIFGPQSEPLLIRSPENPCKLVHVAEIQAGAVATSATYFSRRTRGHRVVTPLVNGQTRSALNFPGSVTVIASSCMWSDALTKVIAIDHRKGASLLKHFDAQAILLDSDGDCLLVRVFPTTTETQEDYDRSVRI
jgi:thiamine biosynthesis lipoprotein